MTAGWLYFGCKDGPGHYLFGDKAGLSRDIVRRLESLDGKLAPHPERGDQLYEAAFSRLGGLGFSALSWWDRSVDKRGASNSIIFAPSLLIEPAEMLSKAQLRFPWVFARLPQPVVLWSPR